MNPFDGTSPASASPVGFDDQASSLTAMLPACPSLFLSLVVKQRMQLRNSSYSTVSQAFRSVYRTEGISAFYVSYPTTLVMTIPFTAVQFTCYEFLSVPPPSALISR